MPDFTRSPGSQWKVHLLLVELVLCLQVATGQDVNVTAVVKATPPSPKEGTAATITCSYTVTDTSYLFRYLEWKKGGKNDSLSEAELIASYRNGQSSPINTGYYSMSIENISSSSVLNISSVQFPADEETFWCRVQFRKSGVGNEDGFQYTNLTVTVPPEGDQMKITHGGKDYKNEDTVIMEAAVGEDEDFTCTITGIKPKAEIVTWSIDGMLVPGIPSSEPNAVDPRLYDTSSTTTIEIAKTPQNITLSCATTNRQDGSNETEAGITVKLQVRGSADCLQYRLDVILVCFALTAVNQVWHGIDGMVNQVL